MLPKISVVTVSLNSYATMERTIRSVIRQNYANLEYIVIDGASTDGTVDIIRQYEQYITYWVSEPDGGVYDAMNKGLRAATGDYIIFMNSDDWFVWDALENVAPYLATANADVVFGNVFEVMKDGTKKCTHAWPLEAIHWRVPFCHQAVFMRNTKDRFYNTKYKIAADYDMLYGMYMEGKKFTYIPYNIAFFSFGGLSGDYHRTWMEVIEISCSRLLENPKDIEIYRPRIISAYVRSENWHRFNMKENYDRVLTFLKEQDTSERDMVIFCTGNMVDRYWEIIQSCGHKILCFVDNDGSKQGKTKFGYPIYSSQMLREMRDVIICVMTDNYVDEILDQIEVMKLDSSICVRTYQELRKKYDEWVKEDIVAEGRRTIESFRKYLEITRR